MRVATSETTFPANHSSRSRTHDPSEGPALWRPARRSSEQGDDGTNDLFVSDLIRLNEKQAWFVTEHLTNMKTE